MRTRTGGVDRPANPLAAAGAQGTARPTQPRRHRCSVVRFALGLLTLSMSLAGNDAFRWWYADPATKWEEAIPHGNGRLGAMAFGATTTVHDGQRVTPLALRPGECRTLTSL